MEQPFRSTRPAEQTDINLGVSGTYDVPARLWQDPLSASLIEFRRREQGGLNNCAQAPSQAEVGTQQVAPTLESCLLDELRAEIARKQAGATNVDGSPPVMILPILVRDGYYQDDIENRRRQRYAVLTALMSQQLLPNRNRYIGYLLLPREGDRPEDVEDGLIPYEWLRRDDANHVLVLWAPESLSEDGAQELLRKIACLDDSRDCSSGSVAPVAIIGPATSERLIRIARRALEDFRPSASVAPDDAPETPDLDLGLDARQRALYDSIDAYLDRGITENLRDTVAECIRQQDYAAVRDCLNRQSIADSDQLWVRSTTIPSMLDVGYPQVPPDAVDGYEVVEWALFSAASAYLDAAQFEVDREDLLVALADVFAAGDTPTNLLQLSDLLRTVLRETQRRPMTGVDNVWLAMVGDAAVSVLVTRSDGTLSPTGCRVVAALLERDVAANADACAHVGASGHLLAADERFNALMVLLVANSYLDKGLDLLHGSGVVSRSPIEGRERIQGVASCVSRKADPDATPEAAAAAAGLDPLDLFTTYNRRAEAAISLCLAERFAGIKDSDINWINTVAALSAPGVTKAELQKLAVQLQNGDPPAGPLLALLVSEIINYLDSPPDLGVEEQAAKVQATLTCARNLSARFAADADAVGECLTRHLGPAEDSDPEWARAIADAWQGDLIRVATISARLPRTDAEWLARSRAPVQERDTQSPVRSVRPILISPVASVSAQRVMERLNRSPPIRDTLNQLRLERCLDHVGAGGDEDVRGRRLLRTVLTGSYSCGARRGGFFSEYLETLSDDAMVAVLLRQELGARGVDVFDCGKENPTQSVALVGELDRTFAQVWMAEMMDAAAGCARAGKKQRVARRLAPGRTRFCRNGTACVIRFNYLEGLDGATSDAGKKKRAGETKSALGVTTVDPELLARPVGDSQFDYLRRLADEVRREDLRLRRAGGRGIRAIGIFGSDFYDKLLILQALRQELPNAIYFTNDLDARFLHPANYVWTRNVIVASAYGLTVGPERCREQVPPFRDSYQSSTYVATLIALKRHGLERPADNCMPGGGSRDSGDTDASAAAGESGPNSLLEAIDAWSAPPDPRLFEVSRVGAVDITPTQSIQTGLSSTTYWIHGDVGSTAPDIASYSKVFASIVIFLLLIAVITGSMGTERQLHPFEVLRKIWTFLHDAVRYGGRRGADEDESGDASGEARKKPRRSHAGLWVLLTVNLLTYVFLAIIIFWNELVLYGEGPVRDLLTDSFVQGIAEDLDLTALSLAAIAMVPSLLTILTWWAFRTFGRHQHGVTPFVIGFILSINIVCALGLFYTGSTGSAFFEPAHWFSGVSAWPSELLRLLAAVVGIFGLITAYHVLDEDFRALCDDFFRDKISHDLGIRGHWRFGAWGMDRYLAKRRGEKALSDEINDYVQFSRGSRRVFRAASVGVLHFIAVGLLFAFFGAPPTPVRGEWAQAADWFMLMTFVPITIFATMFVVDATELCDRVVGIIASSRIQPDFSAEKVNQSRLELGLGDKISHESVTEYLRIDLIARHTQPVSRLILLPFGLIALLVVSRSTLFDQWVWNVPLVVAVLSLAGYSLLSAIRLRRAAEEARGMIEARLEATHRRAMGADDSAEVNAEQTASLIKIIRDERRGAFNSWFRNPIFQALLLPFGGAGAVALLEFVLVS